MQCPQCGATVVAPVRFCPVCGQELKGLARSAVADPPIAAPPAPVAPPQPLATHSGSNGLGTTRATSPIATPAIVTQGRRWWWKILLIGTGLYLAVNNVTVGTQNIHLVPQLFMIGTFLVPVVYIAYLYEDGTLYDVPLSKIALLFFFGGVVGSMAASLLESRLITSDESGLFGQLTLFNATIVSLSEELAKLIVILPFLLVARRSYPTIMHGIVMGAAAGMGFAAFESMGYAFRALVESQNLDTMHTLIRVRALLAPLGHGTWTAIIAAALWREQISGRLPLNLNVTVGFLLAVVLHLLWDYVPLWIVGGLPILHLVLGIVGVLILRFFLQSAKGGQGAAYQERDLATALRLYAGDLRSTVRGTARRKQ